jgi:NAD(P)H-hydrate epimerase
MLPLLDAAAMRAADAHTIETIGLPGAVLMENAGAAVAELVRDVFPRGRLVVLCGQGNNGGDGFVAARRLLARAPRLILVGARADLRGDASLHCEAFVRSGGMLEELRDIAAWQACRDELRRADVLIDALLGTGLRAGARGLVGALITDIAGWSDGPAIVSVDLPSGLSSDDGQVPGPALRAAHTVTFAAPKLGHVLEPACDHVGRLHVADIGIPPAVLAARAVAWQAEPADVAACFGTRRPAAHKGDFGHVHVLGGSPGKTGAPVLTGTAALRAGAGLVSLAAPAGLLPGLVAAARPELMTVGLASRDALTWDDALLAAALEVAARGDAVVLGPGLGQTPGCAAFVRAFVSACPVPLLIDADALNALAADERAGLAAVSQRSAPTVLTPHPGEMARLTGSSNAAVQAQRSTHARALAQTTRAVVVLKGQRTLSAAPDGRLAVNPTGNPGLATAGSGDVLAGLVGALLARGRDAFDAAVAGVLVHGLAGDRAAQRLGQEALLAGDVVEALGEALRALGVGVP